MIADLIRKNRSFRRFDQNHTIDRTTLCELIDLARLSASGANIQPLKYVLACDPKLNAQIFEHLTWAGYLTDWPGPAPGERPTAYIIMLRDTNIRPDPGCDHGIAAQSILLGAAERGLGGCMIGSIKRPEVAQLLRLPEHLKIALVIALGKPAEKVVLENTGPEGSIKYYRDAHDVHHVPKRPLTEIILNA